MTEKPPQTITGSNVQTGTEMPVQQTVAGSVGAQAEAGGAIQPQTFVDWRDALDDIDEKFAEKRTVRGREKDLAFFRVEPQPYSEALGERLTSLSRAGDDKTTTKQIVFFKAPDGRVYGLGTTKTRQKGVDYYRVTPNPGSAVQKVGRNGESMRNISDLMSEGFTPIGSMRKKTPFKANDRSATIQFADEAEFNEFAETADERLYGVRSDAEGFQAQQTGVEGEGAAGRVRVSNVTPADELAAKEGFTMDEAEALWPFISGTKIDGISTGLLKALRDPDGLYALAKLSNLLITNEIIETESEAFSYIGHLVVESRKGTSVGKKAFTESLTRLVGEEIRGRNAQAAGSAGSQPDRATGEDAGTAGAGRQAEEAVDDRGEGVEEDGLDLVSESDETIAARIRDAKSRIRELFKLRYTDKRILSSTAAEILGAKRTLAIIKALRDESQSEDAQYQKDIETIYGASSEEDEDTRYHSGSIADLHRPTQQQIGAAFQQTLLSAAGGGLNVTLLQQEAAQMAQEMGVVSTRDGRIALVMENLVNPSVNNLYHLNAEIAHYVFAGFTPSMQDSLQRAIRKVSNEFLGVTQEFRIAPGADVDAVTQEERLVDVVARSLAQQGFNPAESRGMAQRFWRALKDILLRAGMAFGRAFGLNDNASATLAAEFLQNRVEGFLAGNVRQSYAVELTGGRKLAPQDQNLNHKPVNGFTAVNFRYDAENGQIVVQPVEPDSAEALLHNASNPTIRYHTSPGGRDSGARLSPDTSADVSLYDIAANNEFNQLLNTTFQAWTASGNNTLPGGGQGMDFEQFKAWVLGRSADPVQVIKEFAAQATALGIPVPNTATRLNDLNADAQRESANRIYQKMSRFLSKLQKRYDEDTNETSLEPGSEQRVYNRNVLAVQTLTAKFDNTDAVMDEIRQNISALVKFLKDDISRVGSLSHRRGMYAEMIRSIEGKFTADIGSQYAQAMNRLVKRFTESATESTNFVNLLAKIADMPVYFGESDAATIKDWLTSATDPDFAILQQDSVDSRALLTIAATFAKRNALMMHMLSLRRAGAENDILQEKIRINEAIKIAMGSGRQATKDALRHINSLEKLKERATRIIIELDKIRQQQDVLRNSLEARRKFMAFYEGNKALLQEQMAVYERSIGAVQEFFEPFPEAEYIVPSNPNITPELALKEKTARKKYTPTRDGAANDELKRDIKAMEDWLEANQATAWAGGAFYNRIQMQAEKLKENSMEGEINRGTRNLITSMVGSVVEKFEKTGNPPLKQLARMFRNFEAWHLRYKQDEHNWATDWSRAADKARTALGYNKQQMDVFLETYYGPSFDYVARRLDLQVAGAGAEQSVNLGLAAIRTRYPQLTDAQWSALENLLRETVKVSDSILKASDEMGNLIKDEKTGIYRKVRGAKLFELMRTYNGTIKRVFKQMAGEAGKPGLWTAEPWDFSTILQEVASDLNAARSKYAAYFTGEIWERFLGPLANRSGRSAFHIPDDGSGIRQLARVVDVRTAFEQAAPGDIVGFAENLFAITGGLNQPGAKEAFIVDTMKTVHNFYKSRLSAMMGEQTGMAGRSMVPINQALMTARSTDEDPAEWMEYRRFDLHSVRSLMQQLTLHSAFGRNLETADRLFAQAEDELQKKENILKVKIVDPVMRTPGVSWRQSKIRKLLEKQAAAVGEDLKSLELASQHLAMLRYEKSNFDAFVSSHGGIAMEFKWWSQLLSAFVSWTVQGPKTALVDTNSLFKPIQEIGLSTQALNWTMQSAKHTVLQNVGGFLEIFGKTLKVEADTIRMLHEHGQYPSSDQYTYKDRMLSAIMGNPVEPGASRLSRVLRGIGIGGIAAREILSSGLPSLTKAKDAQFVRIKPAVFTQIGQTMHLGAVAGTWRTFEDMVTRAANWLNNPARQLELNDPAFQFDKSHASELGYGNKFFGLLNDESAFVTLMSKLKQNGMTLESLAKDYVARGMGGPVMSNDAYRKLIVIGPSEIMQESSIVSRPSWMVTNPIGRAALPLVGWSLSQTGSVVRTSGKDISGEFAGYKQLMLRMAPILGIGLAYSLLSDWWDEDVLKKKSNRLTFTGDNAAAALVDKLAMSGTLGIVGDFANSFVNVSTAREFTIDSRVFAVSSFQGIFRALSTYYHQGSATYSTVGRPLLQAMGGNGAIQYMQVLNGIVGLDNAEARATTRVNVNNWLRVVGRDQNLTVKTAKGGDFVPTRTTPYVREMVLAAYANDYAGFQRAWREAVRSARADKRENPQEYVKRAFQYQHPLRSVYQTVPSERDYARITRAMPESGRRDVMEAIALFNRYGTTLGIDPFTGQKEKRLNPVFDRMTLLRRDASGLLGSL